MATLVERVRALQGGLPLDAAALAQRRAEVAAGTTVTAGNLPDRLTEAVQSGNDAALDVCLTAPVGHAAIRSAATAVPGPVAEAALSAAYGRLRRRPGRGKQLAVWIQALLHSHAAHLQQSPEAASLLGTMQGGVTAAALAHNDISAVQQRQLLQALSSTIAEAASLLGALQGGVAAAAAAQGQLLSLAGRLQLALAQQQRPGQPAAPPPLQFADEDMLQNDPAAADAMVDPDPAPTLNLVSDEDDDEEEGSHSEAWGSGSGDETGSEADSSADEAKE